MVNFEQRVDKVHTLFRKVIQFLTVGLLTLQVCFAFLFLGARIRSTLVNHFVESYAKCVKVRRLVLFNSIFEGLKSHILVGSIRCSWVIYCRNTQINKLHIAAWTNDNILGFEISVQDFIRMKTVQSLYQLHCYEFHFWFIQSLWIAEQTFSQIFSFYEFH